MFPDAVKTINKISFTSIVVEWLQKDTKSSKPGQMKPKLSVWLHTTREKLEKCVFLTFIFKNNVGSRL